MGWSSIAETQFAAGKIDLPILDEGDFGRLEGALQVLYDQMRRQAEVSISETLTAAASDGVSDLWAEAMGGELGDMIGDATLDAALGAGFEYGFDVPDSIVSDVVEEQLASMDQHAQRLQVQVEEWVAKQVSAGMPGHEIVSLLNTNSPLADARASGVATTEAVAAANAGMYAAWASDGDILGKTWVTSRDERVRPTHISMEGVTVAPDDVFIVDGYEARFPGDPQLPAGLRINCLPGWQPVTAQSVSHAYRRPFAGELVELITAGGRKITATPNHPVLTADGLVPIGEIENGTHVVADARSVPAERRADPDVDDAPTTIEQRVVAASGGPLLEGLPVVPVDFHGDGFAGEVDVVALDGELWDRMQTEAEEHPLEFGLATADVASAGLGVQRATTALGRARGGPSSSDVGLGSESGPLTLIEPGHAEELLLAASAQGNVGSLQPFGDRDASDANLVGEELGRLAGQVTLDEVVGVRRYEWSGHVHNLQTATALYQADGVIVGNCRCILVATTSTRRRTANRTGTATTKEELRTWARDMGLAPGNRTKAELQDLLLSNSCSNGVAQSLFAAAGRQTEASRSCAVTLERLSRNQLLVQAKAHQIPGRHRMTRAQLQAAVAVETRWIETEAARAARAYAPKKTFDGSRKIADRKTRNVPKPSDERIVGGLKASAEASQQGKRAGGDKRSGAATRRKRDVKLWEEFGGPQRGYVACVYCGSKLHYLDPDRFPEMNVHGYEKFQRDKIIDSKSGGSYIVENVLPSCSACNNARKNKGHGFSMPSWGDPVKYAKKRADELIGPGAWDNPGKYAKELGLVASAQWADLSLTSKAVAFGLDSSPWSRSLTSMRARMTNRSSTLLRGSSRSSTWRALTTGESALPVVRSTRIPSSRWTELAFKPYVRNGRWIDGTAGDRRPQRRDRKVGKSIADGRLFVHAADGTRIEMDDPHGLVEFAEVHELLNGAADAFDFRPIDVGGPIVVRVQNADEVASSFAVPGASTADAESIGGRTYAYVRRSVPNEIFVNGEMFDDLEGVGWTAGLRSPGGFMPAVTSTSIGRYMMAHEYAHLADNQAYRSGDDYEPRQREAAGTGEGLSSYGRTSPPEAFAETYAEWTISQGTTANPAALAFAREFEWTT